MKKNLILLIPLFVMQMVSAQTYPNFEFSTQPTTVEKTNPFKVEITFPVKITGTAGLINNGTWNYYLHPKAYGIEVVGQSTSIPITNTVLFHINSTVNYTCTLSNLTKGTNYTVKFFIVYNIVVIDGTNTRQTVYENLKEYGNEFTFKTSGTSGTAVLDNKEDNFKVYPNPSKGKFNVDLDNSTPNNKIKIFDTTGRLVYSTEILNTKNEIDLTDKNLNGIYLMKVINVYGICVNESKLVFD